MEDICIAVDAMGGDYGPSVTVPASLRALADTPGLKIILLGDEDLIKAELVSVSYDPSRLIIQHTTETVSSYDAPVVALRTKRNSSMRLALNMVADNTAQACVSAGNTGALMAIARFVLKTLPCIDRPAILFPLPSMQNDVYMLDLGANVDCNAEHLVQFAVMGSILLQAINQAKPKVALLNIGHEAIKGTDAVKQASQILEGYAEIGYVGFIEGHDIYSGNVDLVVCDGFVGNVALKASEGVAKMIIKQIRAQFMKSWYGKIVGIMATPILKQLVKKFDPNNYNGASLLGLQGVVIKSHGGAQEYSFYKALLRAVIEAKMQVPKKIGAYVSEVLGDS